MLPLRLVSAMARLLAIMMVALYIDRPFREFRVVVAVMVE